VVMLVANVQTDSTFSTLFVCLVLHYAPAHLSTTTANHATRFRTKIQITHCSLSIRHQTIGVYYATHKFRVACHAAT